jgi:hypothetical protein
VARDAELAELLQERAWGEGLAGAAGGEQPEAGGLAAVFMFARLAASSVSIAGRRTSSGTGILRTAGHGPRWLGPNSGALPRNQGRRARAPPGTTPAARARDAGMTQRA